MQGLKSGNEDPPAEATKVAENYRPPRSLIHRVSDGENWTILAARYKVDARTLIWQNFQTDNAKVVNWYLHYYVKCDKTTPDRYNWRFSTSSRNGGGFRPGIIFVTPNWRAILDAAKFLTR
jgi:hypothetical protein